MSWSEPKQNWSTDGVRHRYQTEKGFVILAPLRHPRLLRRSVSPPTDAPVWFVQNLFVEEEERGKGNGMGLLREAIKRLPKLTGGPAYLALYRDNVNHPRRTTEAARGCWSKCLEEEELEASDGFLRLGGDS